MKRTFSTALAAMMLCIPAIAETSETVSEEKETKKEKKEVKEQPNISKNDFLSGLADDKRPTKKIKRK